MVRDFVSQTDDNNILANQSICFKVTGRVQGVFFRASCKSIADQYGIKGWVRNLPDGRVEGIATADPVKIEIFRKWIKQGPDMARVLQVEVGEIELQEFDNFQIR